MFSLIRSFLVVVSVTAAALAQTAIPGGSQSATYVISKPGRYYLAADRLMTNPNADAIEVTATDVTIDLNGFSLRYATTNGVGRGIQALTAVNLEIRNGSILDTPSAAINSEIVSGSDVRLLDLRVSGCGGISLASKNVMVERCMLSDMRGNAILLSGAASILRNNSIRMVTLGCGIVADGGCLVEGNVLVEIAYSGIWLRGVDQHGGMVRNNTVRRCNLDKGQWIAGIESSGQRGVVIVGNSVSDCFGTGIRVGYDSAVESNLVTGTKASEYSGVGHGIYSPNSATIVRNNSGANNLGNLLSGYYTDAGGNVGS